MVLVAIIVTLCLSVLQVSPSAVVAPPCPTWHYHDNSSDICKCGANLYCFSDDTVEIKEGYCATSAGYGDLYYVGLCYFRHTVNNTNRLFSEMPCDPHQLDEVMCGHFNRKGLLCGECFKGFGPAIYSLDLKCANCSQISTGYAVTAYMLLELAPITVFYLLVLLFRLNIISGPMIGYVFFCQLFALYGESSSIIKYSSSQNKLLQVGLFLCRILTIHWILKPLFPTFCISSRLTDIHVQLLSLVSVTYPVVLVFLTCILIELHSRNNWLVCNAWKPFRFIFKKLKLTVATNDSVIHAFASFIFLANTTIFNTFITLILQTNIRKPDGSLYKRAVAIDPTLEHGSKEHILYIVIAALPLFFLTLLPLLLLSIYPTKLYKYLSQFISARKRLVITIFAEALHSSLKDGLNGTRDYRALAGLYPLITIMGWFSVMITELIGYSERRGLIFFLLFCIVAVSFIRPFKSNVSNVSVVFFFVLGIILCMVEHMWYHDFTSIQTLPLENTLIIVCITPHIMIFIWAGYKFILYTKQRFHSFYTSHFDCLVPQSAGYQQLYNELLI